MGLVLRRLAVTIMIRNIKEPINKFAEMGNKENGDDLLEINKFERNFEILPRELVSGVRDLISEVRELKLDVREMKLNLKELKSGRS